MKHFERLVPFLASILQNGGKNGVVLVSNVKDEFYDQENIHNDVLHVDIQQKVNLYDTMTFLQKPGPH